MIDWLNITTVLGEWASGVAGAASAAVFVWLIKSVKAEYLNRKFPVAGAYLTRFEDTVDGEKVSCFAPATIKQRGRTISGETSIDHKTWTIEGEITEGGYVYGCYAASSPHDSGIGNFFLQIKDTGDLEGFWSGFDAENKMVTSGKYVFLKTPKFKVKTVGNDDIPALLAISSQTLGEGYVQHIIDNDSKSSTNVFLAAILDGKPIAYCYAYIVDVESWEDVTKGNKIKIPIDVRHCLSNGCLGVIQTIAVSPKYQGRGVASKLVKETMRQLSQKGALGFVSIAWRNLDKINIKNVLERSGFNEFDQVEKFWHKESLKEGYECPSCGNPCECSAIMYKYIP